MSNARSGLAPRMAAPFGLLNIKGFVEWIMLEACSGFQPVAGLQYRRCHGSFFSSSVHCRICRIVHEEGMPWSLPSHGGSSSVSNIEGLVDLSMMEACPGIWPPLGPGRRPPRGSFLSRVLYVAGFLIKPLVKTFSGLQPLLGLDPGPGMAACSQVLSTARGVALSSVKACSDN